MLTILANSRGDGGVSAPLRRAITSRIPWTGTVRRARNQSRSRPFKILPLHLTERHEHEHVHDAMAHIRLGSTSHLDVSASPPIAVALVHVNKWRYVPGRDIGRWLDGMISARPPPP